MLLQLLLLVLLNLRCQANPLPTCPEDCPEYGTCNPEIGRCECPVLRHGPNCGIPVKEPEKQCAAYSHLLDTCVGFNKTNCLNGCNGRGWCEGGFCLCKRGFYGADCSLSTGEDGRPELLAGQNYTVRRTGVKVYVYELPPLTNTWVYIARVDRPVVQVLMQRLLASGARTANGDEADWYLIPFLLRTRTHAHSHLAATIHHIRQHWPWWDRRGGGHRHLLVVPGDHGRHTLSPELLALTDNVTFLTHWGLISDHGGGRWAAAHRPHRDIVLPPLTIPDDPIVYSPLHPGIRRKKERDGLLFFAGRICGDNQEPVEGRCSDVRPDFSGNTRQQVALHHWNRSDFTITVHQTMYTEGLITHLFCLAPTGSGYGRRSVLALIMGCIPVTLTDHVLQPFEPELNWKRFSVSVAEKDIPRMHEILAAIAANATRIKELQDAGRCAAQHMHYSSTFGEVMGEDGRFDAVETLLEVLRMRRDNPRLAPEHYRRADQRFGDFARCRLEPTGERVKLCTHNRLAKAEGLVRCREVYDGMPMRVMRVFYAWPGGAACGRQELVGQCPRSWA